VELFGACYTGVDQGDAVAGWLSAVLGTPSRLVRVPPGHQRVTDGETPGTSGYADSCPVLLTSLSALDLLTERIAEHGGEPVPMSRFRPNVVVSGWSAPHTEERARRIGIGGAELGYAKPAVRCVVTMVDQESARGTARNRCTRSPATVAPRRAWCSAPNSPCCGRVSWP
jgi:hypothetical protein